MTVLAVAGIAMFAVAVVVVSVAGARDAVRQYRSLRALVRAGLALARSERLRRGLDSDRG